MQTDRALDRRLLSLDRMRTVATALMFVAVASSSGCTETDAEELAPDPAAIAEFGIDPGSVTCMAVDDAPQAAPPSASAPAGEAPDACPPGYELQDSDGAIDT